MEVLATRAMGLHALVLGGVVPCPFIPVLDWLLIRRHLAGGIPGHRREP
jgi:hypothetical protein